LSISEEVTAMSSPSLSFLTSRPGDLSRLVLSKAQAKKAIERTDKHGRNFRGEYIYTVIQTIYICGIRWDLYTT